jgi:hypothetical protein
VIEILEPELQPQGSMPPPAPPKRSAVATDDEERRPCQRPGCGHKRAEHLGGPCHASLTPSAWLMVQAGSNVQIKADCQCPEFLTEAP